MLLGTLDTQGRIIQGNIPLPGIFCIFPCKIGIFDRKLDVHFIVFQNIYPCRYPHSTVWIPVILHIGKSFISVVQTIDHFFLTFICNQKQKKIRIQTAACTEILLHKDILCKHFKDTVPYFIAIIFIDISKIIDIHILNGIYFIRLGMCQNFNHRFTECLLIVQPCQRIFFLEGTELFPAFCDPIAQGHKNSHHTGQFLKNFQLSRLPLPFFVQ